MSVTLDSEIRWYKGKYKVEVLKKSKGNWLVKALEKFNILRKGRIMPSIAKTVEVGDEFTTVPRLLWKKPREK